MVGMSHVQQGCAYNILAIMARLYSLWIRSYSVSSDAGNNALSALYKNSGELLLHAARQSILRATMDHVGYPFRAK